MDDFELNSYYQVLEILPGASAEEIQAAYLKKVALKRRERQKADLETLKIAYQKLWNHTLQQQYDKAEKLPQDDLSQQINARLKPHHVQGTVHLKDSLLSLIFDAEKVSPQQVPPSLLQPLLRDLNLSQVETVKVMGKRGGKTIFWKYQFPYTPTPVHSETEQLLQKAEDNMRIWGFPVALILAMSLNITGINWLWNMLVHELGHASIAWFSGYRAMPTFALTVVSEYKSLFVYFGILFLLGLLIWSGKKEGKNWAIILGMILIIIQFYMTWIMDRETYDFWQAFGGVGAEFYLSTLFIICFYFPLPERLHWDFWRYLFLVVGFSTLLASFVKWHRINKGQEDIPWGSFWGGEGDTGGDMNTLTEYFDWSDSQIIDTYRILGHICLWIIVGFYLYFFIKSSSQCRRYFKNFQK